MLNGLQQINFNQVLDYSTIPVPTKKTGRELYKCLGFCTKCERSGCVRSPEKQILISHGCSTAEFESMPGVLPVKRVFDPIMFVFENPGGNYGNCNESLCDGITKWPPVNHYYWTPSVEKWPETTDDIINPYGDYLAYLMVRHGLANVYITNCVKCKYTKDNYERTANMCVEAYLKKEVDIVNPKIIFCFGKNADNLVYCKLGIGGNRKFCILHPRVIDDNRQKKTIQPLWHSIKKMTSALRVH